MAIGCNHDDRFVDGGDTKHCVYCRALAAEREVRDLRNELDGYAQGGFNGPSAIPCCKCGGPVVEFTVPNEAWNAIIRGDRGETNQEYLCLACFAKAAADKIERLKAELADGIALACNMLPSNCPERQQPCEDSLDEQLGVAQDVIARLQVLADELLQAKENRMPVSRKEVKGEESNLSR